MHFLQLNEWEAFQRQLGHPTHRIGDVLVIEKKTPVGPYWYVARARMSPEILKEIESQAKQAGAVFVRVDPARELRITNYELRIRSTAATQPQDSLILDLTPSIEDLLASFHTKTRYNIRLAERKGVVVEESADPAHRAFRAFIELGKRTGSRQGIRFHTEDYYRTMLETLQTPELSASVVVAHWENRPLAANLMLWVGETAYYLHGASWHEHRQFMAPHLLQWSCIGRAKERGCTDYDFWGIAPNATRSENYQLSTINYQPDENHPWAGITRFKLGFGGEVTHAPDSFDLVLNPTVYSIYTMGRRIRRTLGRTW